MINCRKIGEMIASRVYKLIVANLEITVTFVVLSSNHTVSSLQFQLYIFYIYYLES